MIQLCAVFVFRRNGFRESMCMSLFTELKPTWVICARRIAGREWKDSIVYFVHGILCSIMRLKCALE